MLKLILGLAKSGKTTQILQLMHKHATSGGRGIFLVPEQFSSSAEMLVYTTLGDEKSAHIEVLSFRTLSERILKASGGLNTKTLTEAGRLVFVRRALDALGDNLATFVRHRRSAAFCNKCAQVISEFKIAGVTPTLLNQIARDTNEQKFADLALIYEAYESAINGIALDQEDRLTLAAESAACGYLTNKACYIDDFDGFTAPEYYMLEQMLPQCESVTIALCCNHLHETEDGLGVFSPVRRTAQRVLALAQKTGRKAAAPLVLGAPMHPQNPALQALNLLLSGQELPAPIAQSPPAITLTNPPNQEEEMRLVAAEMRRLALDGVPFSSMAIVCRDISTYESVLRRAMAQFNIPCFIDASATIEYTAPVSFLCAALGILRRGLASEPLLALLKTGLCGATGEDIAALENYVFTWEPKAAEWRNTFTGNPDGLLAALSETGARQLERAESLRASFVPVIEQFVQNARSKTAAELSKQLYLLLDTFSADTHIETAAQRFQQNGETERAETTRRAWDLTMDLLDQMATLLVAERLSPAEYEEMFILLVRSTDFGQAPQMLECAVFTSADRMRLSGPEYCFVVGAVEGEFPMQVGYSGLLTHSDRDLLVSGGVHMPGSFEHRTLLEEMFFYRALTLPSKGLHISWPARRAGAIKSMSAALEPIKLTFEPPTLSPPLHLLSATPLAAFDMLSQLYRNNSPATASLQKALQTSDSAQAQNMLSMLRHVQNNGVFDVIDAAALDGLIGGDFTLSATRAERYYECRFAYYMERLMSVRPRRKAEISPLESGTFVHHVLEQVLREAGESFPNCTDEALHAMSARHADEFIAQNLPVVTRRAEYLLQQIKQATSQLLYYLRDGAQQSGFTINAVELNLDGSESGVPPLEVHTPAGRSVRVTGKIDRVDVLRKDGKNYLCIIDYKTGGKKFSLADVYCGINMQMMIYMQALCEKAQNRYPDALPAAVLYLTGDPAPTTGVRGGQPAPAFAMDGLLLDDPDILKALDKDGAGEFLPVKHKAGVVSRPGERLASQATLQGISARVHTLLADMADGIYSGDFDAVPLVNKNRRPCDWCAYRAACRHEDGRREREVQLPENAFAPTPDATTAEVKP